MSLRKKIFDISVNVGNYSSILIEESKLSNCEIELHLFKQTRKCFKIPSEKFALNNNIILNNFGISDQEAIVTKCYDKEMNGLAFLYKRNLDSYNIKLCSEKKIRLKRMDEYIKEKKLEYIHFIKKTFF